MLVLVEAFAGIFVFAGLGQVLKWVSLLLDPEAGRYYYERERRGYGGYSGRGMKVK